jgi:1L-myo-inositol 1-phosphate cytidylyltransferase
MAAVKQCLILAAGMGSRIRAVSGTDPKPLVSVRDIPLLEHVLLSAQEAGIEEFFVVTGHQSDILRRWFDSSGLENVCVTWIENSHYQRDNGVSVLQAKDLLHDPFLLLMSDHLFEPQTAKRLLHQSISHDEVILAVDRKVHTVFDLEDATKVRLDGDHIVDIGKEIAFYDALDTGMFLCGPGIFEALESEKKNGNCSLSDGMRKLARQWRFRAFDIGAAHWQDVDTPETRDYAESIFDEYFRDNPVGRRFAHV